MVATKSRRAKKSGATPPQRAIAKEARTLTIDIGGTGIKMLLLDAEGRSLSERLRELTPQPPLPRSVLAVVRKMLAGVAGYDRVSVGFPGVVVHGIVQTAANLGTPRWRTFKLQQAVEQLTRKPTLAINDVDLQGYGVIQSKGVELVLTLGTGLGSALYSDGHLVPNLEIAHHLIANDRTYEERVSNAELKRIGKKKWNRRVREVIASLAPILNYDILYIGGGNARKLSGALPSNVRIFENVEGMAGGVRLWNDVSPLLAGRPPLKEIV